MATSALTTTRLRRSFSPPPPHGAAPGQAKRSTPHKARLSRTHLTNDACSTFGPEARASRTQCRRATPREALVGAKFGWCRWLLLRRSFGAERRLKQRWVFFQFWARVVAVKQQRPQRKGGGERRCEWGWRMHGHRLHRRARQLADELGLELGSTFGSTVGANGACSKEAKETRVGI